MPVGSPAAEDGVATGGSRPGIDEVIERIRRRGEPLSAFVYGSIARGDAVPASDLEIGLVFDERDEPAHRRDFIGLAPHVRVYTFSRDAFRHDPIRTPFQSSVYLRELSLTARTVLGERIVETFIPPVINMLDIYGEVRYNAGRAVGALQSVRAGDLASAADGIVKSWFMATRALCILRDATFLTSYSSIVSWSEAQDLGEHASLRGVISKLRRSETTASELIAFNNVSYLSDLVEPEVRASVESEPMRVALP